MISTTSEYALRALSVMAGLPQGASILGKDLASETRIPGRYLSKILGTLHGAGIVDAARGSNGGYWLAKAADSIRMQDVIALFDRGSAPRNCLLWPDDQCSSKHPCSAHGSWSAVRDAYACFLENVTLADISERPHGNKEQMSLSGGLR